MIVTKKCSLAGKLIKHVIQSLIFPSDSPIFFRKFQLITSTPDNSFLSSGQDNNKFFV